MKAGANLTSRSSMEVYRSDTGAIMFSTDGSSPRSFCKNLRTRADGFLRLKSKARRSAPCPGASLQK